MVDWTGNMNSIYKILGASNHTDKERQSEDYYATDPIAIDKLLEYETFTPKVWECACGAGHLSERLTYYGYDVRNTDIVDRGYPDTEVRDFLTIFGPNCDRDIITNPPYKFAKEFVEHALDISENGIRVAMFLKLQFLEGQARKELFKKYPLKTLYVFSKRVLCAKNGEFQRMRDGGGSAVAYGWFVWEKGYKGEPVIRWI